MASDSVRMNNRWRLLIFSFWLLLMVTVPVPVYLGVSFSTFPLALWWLSLGNFIKDPTDLFLLLLQVSGYSLALALLSAFIGRQVAHIQTRKIRYLLVAALLLVPLGIGFLPLYYFVAVSGIQGTTNLYALWHEIIMRSDYKP